MCAAWVNVRSLGEFALGLREVSRSGRAGGKEAEGTWLRGTGGFHEELAEKSRNFYTGQKFMSESG